MPIFLLWIDVVFDSHKQLTTYQAALSSTQLVLKAHPVLFEDVTAETTTQVENATILLLEEAAARGHGNTIVFLTGVHMVSLYKQLRLVFPNLFTRKLLHHRLIDLDMLTSFVARWGTPSSFDVSDHNIGNTTIEGSHDSLRPSIQHNMCLLQHYRQTLFSCKVPAFPSSPSDEQKDAADTGAGGGEGAGEGDIVDGVSSTSISNSNSKSVDLWLDLELTGLDLRRDRPLEISCLMTDPVTLEQYEQMDLVLAVPSGWSVVDMDVWSHANHEASRLLTEVKQTLITVSDAEERLLQWLKSVPGPCTAAGASVWFDKIILELWMPRLAARLSDQVFDISVVLECCRWYKPEVYRNRPTALAPAHRTSSDVQSSLNLARYLRDQLLVSTSMTAPMTTTAAEGEQSDAGFAASSSYSSSSSSSSSTSYVDPSFAVDSDPYRYYAQHNHGHSQPQSSYTPHHQPYGYYVDAWGTTYWAGERPPLSSSTTRAGAAASRTRMPLYTNDFDTSSSYSSSSSSKGIAKFHMELEQFPPLPRGTFVSTAAKVGSDVPNNHALPGLEVPEDGGEGRATTTRKLYVPPNRRAPSGSRTVAGNGSSS